MGNRKNKRRDGEGTRARLAREAAEAKRKADQNERQKRCRGKKRLQLEESADFADLPEVVGSSNGDMERSTTRLASKVAVDWFNQTAERGPEYQRMLLPKIIKDSIWHTTMPRFVMNSERLQHAESTLNNIARGWKQIKGCHSKDDQQARNVIIPMLVFNDTMNTKQTSELTGIHRRNFARGYERRLNLDEGTSGGVWALSQRAKRRDAIPEVVQKLAVRWWTDQTRVSPNRKDVVRKRVGLKRWESHAAYLLQGSQEMQFMLDDLFLLQFYTNFKEAHTDLKLALRSFERLKPWFVRRLKEFNSCCCRYHAQMSELKDGFNFMRASALHESCECRCEVCSRQSVEFTVHDQCCARNSIVAGIRNLCELVMCPKNELAEFHNLECIKGLCTNCGVNRLRFCPSEFNSQEQLVNWRCFEDVPAGRTKEGEVKTVVRLEHKQTSPSIFIEFLKPKLEEFLVHTFEATWQDNQFKKCLENLTSDQIVSVVDYAENYSFKEHNEIQSQHWYNFQITILVHLTFRLNPDWDGVDVDSRILREYHYYISDDKKHDNLFAQHCFKLHWNFLKEQGLPLPTEHIVFSDGCSCQFKCARAFFFVARYPSLTVCEELPEGCVMQWNHFGSGHGKGTWDGAGAGVKQCLRCEQVKPNGAKLHNAHDVVEFLRQRMSEEHAAYTRARRDVHRYFYEIKVNDVNRADPLNARTIGGTRSLHQIRSVGLDKISLQIRVLSCFCSFCMDGGDGPCDNVGYVPRFDLIRLEPCNPGDARWDVEPVELSVESDGEILATTLSIGDHFAVAADEGNEEGDDFWVLVCEEGLHMVEDTRKVDNWGQEVNFGDMIVIGRYYKRQGRSGSSYVLTNNWSAFIYSNHIVAVKFQMEVAAHRQRGGRAGVQVYTLAAHIVDHIQAVLKHRSD